MSRIEREKQTVSMMIEFYCRRKLGLKQLPEEYRALELYAHKRLERRQNPLLQDVLYG